MLITNDARTKKKGRAVVIGGSLAGLLAARVLTDHFQDVTVIERDCFPQGGPAPRKGIPQSHHVHALLLRGKRVFEELFPGLDDEMSAAGALTVDMARDTAWLTPAGWGVRYHSNLGVLSFTRDLLDWHVRRRLAAHPQVCFVEASEVTRLLPGRKDTVAGAAVCSRRGATGDAAALEIYADLIVDASGRGSRAPQWLEALGYDAPEEVIVNSFRGYASRLFEIPPGHRSDWKGIYLQAVPPQQKRGGLLLPVEGDRWLVTLIGGGKDYPPPDEAGFMAFARSLRSPLLFRAIEGAAPLTPVATFRATENRLRRFERLAHSPHNFVALGDAVCAFNPVYGQGMTAAALGVLNLREVLIEQGRRSPARDWTGFSRRFHRKLARANAAPWLLATGEDFRYRETIGGTPSFTTRVMHRYLDGVTRLTTEKPDVRQTLLEVFHMLKPPTALFRHGILGHLLKQFLRSPVRTRLPTSPPFRQRSEQETN